MKKGNIYNISIKRRTMKIKKYCKKKMQKIVILMKSIVLFKLIFAYVLP